MPTLTSRRAQSGSADRSPAAALAAAGPVRRWRPAFRRPTGDSGRGLNLPQVRLMIVGVWALVLAWPLAAVHLFAARSSATLSAGPVAVFPRALDARAAQFLRVWLAAGEGTEQSLSGYLPRLPQLTGVRPGSLTADWVTSYSITHTGGTEDYAVLLMAGVSAHPATTASPSSPATTGSATGVAGAAPSGSAAGPSTDTVRCYQVVLTAVGRGYNPTVAPAQTACPTSRLPAAVPLTELAATGSDGSVPDTVSRWLQAYLSGVGDITRYTRPGVHLPAISPSPARSVTVTDLALTLGNTLGAGVPADGTSIHVLATVTATDATGIASQLTYPLTLTARGGRWEVSALELTTHPTTTPTTSTSAPGPSH